MTMRALVWNLPSAVWAVLSLATLLSWWLGTGHGVGAAQQASQQTGLIVLGLAFFKVRLVIRHFMEVAHAPIALRLITDGWLLIVCGAVIGLYLRSVA